MEDVVSGYRLLTDWAKRRERRRRRVQQEGIKAIEVGWPTVGRLDLHINVIRNHAEIGEAGDE